MAKAPKRRVFHSSLTKAGWEVKENRETLSKHETQLDCEGAAIKLARSIYNAGGLAQVVFHKSDGAIREERTYGKDPERTPG